MSIDIFKDVVCIDFGTGLKKDHHSLIVGKKCAYCCDCCRIIVEYKDVKDFKRLMNPFGDEE